MNKLDTARYEKKFAVFVKMTEDMKNDRVDTMVIVSHPEVLGDNYDELVESLNRLASAGLKLCIVPPDQRAGAPSGPTVSR
jgi:hypothetical protein